jgi:hypothetical protein
MLESIANILRLLVGYRIDISIADIVEALPGLLYALDLDFAKVVRKLPVISIREISDINVEIGFSLIPFFHKLFPRYSLFQDIIISYKSFQKRIGELTCSDITDLIHKIYSLFNQSRDWVITCVKIEKDCYQA